MTTTEAKPTRAPDRDDWFEELPPPTFTADAYVEHAAACRDTHVCATAPNFRGATLRAMVAAITLDLRDARLVAEGATIELDAALSGIEILVPADWVIVTEVAAVCAQVQTDAAPATSPSGAPELRIVGSIAAGALYVRVTRTRAAAA